MRPSGEQYRIVAAGFEAVITRVGGTLRTLTFQGRPLVAGFDEKEIRPLYRGALLAPWPNRIADGRYEFRGDTHQLPVNEVDRSNALHGLVLWTEWTPVRHEPDRIELGCRLIARDGYPFQLDLSATYAATADGLRCELTALNSGDSDAPYGCAPHPYVVAGPGRVDDWRLELPADHYLEVTPDRLLPVEVRPVAGTSFDFRTARGIGDTFIDHAFTGLARGAGGVARVRVVSPEGTGVEVSWDESCPWVQIHTADRPEPEFDRAGLAVEPMTCPPDAFNSGTDLVVLRPGDRHVASWTITAL